MEATQTHTGNLSAPTCGEEELLALWRRTLDPHGIGLPQAIASDIASYTAEPIDVVLRKMTSGTDDFRRLWQNSAVNTADSTSVAAFYRDQFTEAYELANWHCGRTTGTPPLNYARAARFARRRGLRRVLDFGSGIGSGSLCLAETGCEVWSADIARGLLSFVAHRLGRRGHQPHVVDLNTAAPPCSYFDLITCFDVLEHIPDQLGTLRRLESYLSTGGVLFVNLMRDSRDPNRPMHVSSAGDWLALVRRTGLCPDWSATTPEAQILVRRRGGRWRNCLAAWHDWFGRG
jgi:SAM-dependent methyltransferase